jgi:hypothetical protein
MRMQAQSVIDYSGGGDLTVTKKNGNQIGLNGIAVGRQDTLESFNRDTKARGRSHIDRYQLKVHKNFHNNLSVPPIQGMSGANVTLTESNPIMLQALVATHTNSMTGSSKETLMHVANKKRRFMNETQSGSAMKPLTHKVIDPLSSRSVHEVTLNNHTFL